MDCWVVKRKEVQPIWVGRGRAHTNLWISWKNSLGLGACQNNSAAKTSVKGIFFCDIKRWAVCGASLQSIRIESELGFCELEYTSQDEIGSQQSHGQLSNPPLTLIRPSGFRVTHFLTRKPPRTLPGLQIDNQLNTWC